MKCNEHPDYDGTYYIWNRSCDCVAVFRSKNPFGSPRKKRKPWEAETLIPIIIGSQGQILRLWEYTKGPGNDFNGYDLEVTEEWLDAYYDASDIFRQTLIERIMDGSDYTGQY